MFAATLAVAHPQPLAGGAVLCRPWPKIVPSVGRRSVVFGGAAIQQVNDTTPSVAAVVASKDSELLAAIASGSADAFQEFYRRFGGRVYSYARLLSGRRKADAPKTSRKTSCSPCGGGPRASTTRAATYRVGSTPSPATAFSITVAKAARAREVAADDADLARLAAPEVGVDAGTRVSLEKALGALRLEQREAVELAYFGGLTYEETATRLAVPLGTLKSRIRAALMTMRDLLEETG